MDKKLLAQKHLYFYVFRPKMSSKLADKNSFYAIINIYIFIIMTSKLIVFHTLVYAIFGVYQ